MNGLRLNFMEASGVVRGTSDEILVTVRVTILPWQRLMLSQCLECDDCLWIFDGEGASLDGYRNESAIRVIWW